MSVTIEVHILLGLGMGALASCADPVAENCVPGHSVTCPCAQGGMSNQVCGPDGVYEPCRCGDDTEGAGSVGSDDDDDDDAPTTGDDDDDAAAFDPLWSLGFELGERGSVHDMAIDADGGIYVTGVVYEAPGASVDFGAGPHPAYAATVTPFILKVGSSGALEWSRTFVGGTDDCELYGGYGYAVAVDEDGTVLLGGQTCASTDFEVGAVGPSGLDCFGLIGYLARFDPTGLPLEVQALGEGAITRLRTTPSGGLIAAAYGSTASAECRLDLGDGPISGLVLAHLSSTLALSWRTGFSATLSVGINDVAVNDAGQIAVGGAYAGTFGIGGRPVDSGGNENPWAALLDPSGGIVWGRPFASAVGFGRTTGVAIDADGAAAFTGQFGFEMDFGAGPEPAQGSFEHGFVSSHGPGGSLQWVQNWAPAETGVVVLKAASHEGRRFVVAFAHDDVLVAGETFGETFEPMIVAELAADGSIATHRTFRTDEETTSVARMAIAPDGTLVLAGHSVTDVEFDQELDLDDDGYVVKLSLP